MKAVFKEVGEASGFRAVPSFPGCDRPVESCGDLFKKLLHKEKGNVIAVQRGEMCSLFTSCEFKTLQMCRT